MNFLQSKASIITDSTGVETHFPVILTDGGVLLSLVDYFVHFSNVRSLSWMKKVTYATRLFLDYCSANADALTVSPAKVFGDFSQRLTSGTLGVTGYDPSGLYWAPMAPENARVIVRCLTDFSNWMARELGSYQLNPKTISSSPERILTLMTEHYRSNASFLGHLDNKPKSEYSERSRSAQSPQIAEEAAIAFPSLEFPRLVAQGFTCAGSANIRDILIALLMHGAGFRLSECFHLWVCDVSEDPVDHTLAFVRIHHPQFGAAPADKVDLRGKPRIINREEYLRDYYSIVPRNRLLDNRHAGWKNPALDGKHYMQAHWFPKSYGRLFLALWRVYLRQIINIPRKHPFAFVNLTGAHAGEPYCIETYQEAHQRAVHRIGLPGTKESGTSAHGHRHAFGQRLRRAGVEPKLIQKALHHKSIASQATYTTPTAAEVSGVLDAAEARIAAPNTGLDESENIFKNLMAHGFEDIDPDGLFSGLEPKLVNYK